jgi:hypothetical protein
MYCYSEFFNSQYQSTIPQTCEHYADGKITTAQIFQHLTFSNIFFHLHATLVDADAPLKFYTVKQDAEFNILSIFKCNPESCMILNFKIQCNYEFSILISITFLFFISSCDPDPFNT